VEAIRYQNWFDLGWVGDNVATEVTKTFLEPNTFSLRDATCCAASFLRTPFTCGIEPHEFIRKLPIYIRCECLLEWAGFYASFDPAGKHWGSDLDESGAPTADYK
jgi:hypothetical protein